MPKKSLVISMIETRIKQCCLNLFFSHAKAKGNQVLKNWLCREKVGIADYNKTPKIKQKPQSGYGIKILESIS